MLVGRSGRQDKWHSLMIGVKQDEQRLIRDWMAALVLFFDEIAGQAQPQAACLGILPIFFRQLLPVRPESGNVFNLRSMDLPSKEKLSAP